MKAISLWQPWASWVMWGWKRIETRTHDRFVGLLRERIAIHAAKHFDKNAARLAWAYLTEERRREHARRLLNRDRCFPEGAIICTAHVIDVRKLTPDESRFALIECKTPRIGLCLVAIEQIDPPILCKGRQGIFNVDL